MRLVIGASLKGANDGVRKPGMSSVAPKPGQSFFNSKGHSPIKTIRWPGKTNQYLDVADFPGDYPAAAVQRYRVSASVNQMVHPPEDFLFRFQVSQEVRTAQTELYAQTSST